MQQGVEAVTTGITSQEALAAKAGVHRTYVGRLERGESGVTVEPLAAILAPLGVSLQEFFKPFKEVVRPRTPRRRGYGLPAQPTAHEGLAGA